MYILDFTTSISLEFTIHRIQLLYVITVLHINNKEFFMEVNYMNESAVIEKITWQ